MPAELSLGEIFALRVLEKDETAGAPRYVKGQHFARLLSSDSASLSFVDMGYHLCIIPVIKRGGEWHHLGACIRVSTHTFQAFVISESTFHISDLMREALRDAEERYETRRERKKR